MVSESRLRQSDSERWEAMGRERRFHEKKRDIIVACMTHLSVMAGQAVVVPIPSNQAH